MLMLFNNILCTTKVVFMGLALCLSQVVKSQSLVKNIVCPNPCIGETNYKLALNIFSNSITSSDRGLVKGDSLVNIAPQNYKLSLTVRFLDGTSKSETIDLPICDPIIPQPPLLSNFVVCEGETLPVVKAIVLAQGVTVDWYDQPNGGNKIATGITYQPTTSGTYYAVSRIQSSNCESTQRVSTSVTITKATCIKFALQKVSLR